MRFTVSAGPPARVVHAVLIPVLAGLLALPPQLSAQAATPAAQLSTAITQSLRVLPLAGNGETNDLEGRVMAPLVVNVLDQTGRPVEGADVLFRFPASGPSAAFADKSASQTFRTNADGQAAATGWMANNQTGSVRVEVTATHGNERGALVMTMVNAAHAAAPQLTHKSWWSSKWAKIGILGGAAAIAGVAVWATHGSGSTAGGSGTTISASPGSPTIGGPH